MDAPLKPRTPFGVVAALLLALLIPAFSFAQEEEGTDAADKTLSPYFFVHSDDPEADALPLKSTDVEVAIAGVIADVKVTQRYRNDGKRPIEAEYVFPGSTRAAVYGLTMTVGERRVVAKIREKQKARADYQAAKQQGKSAALLEQHRPNVFKMNVANILPGDDIAVELHYTELLVPADSIYEFVFPTVVGPRYTTKGEAGTVPQDRWQQNPYLHQGGQATSDFTLHVALTSGIAIKEAASPTHKVQVQYRDSQHASIELLRDERRGNNRDFILDYRLAGDAVESGVMLYDDGHEKYFLAMVQPPRRVTPAQIPPRDYVFIVDVSGSMNGFPLDVSKNLMRDLLSGLRPTDTFNVLLFAGGSAALSEKPLPATRQNIAMATAFVDTQQGGGGTELLPALRRALALPGAEERSRSVVVVTDGYVDIEAEAFELVRSNLGQANLFAFGIGSAVNRYLIEGLARAGQGEPFIVMNAEEAPARAAQLREYIEAPVLTKASLIAEGVTIHDLEPRGIPDVLAQRPVVVLGKWDGAASGTLRLRGISGEGLFQKNFELRKIRSESTNSALRYLWARNRIASLADDERIGSDPQRVREITRLGLEYSLLTAYTSFIAIDERVRNANPEDQRTVKQPLPLPQGVSDLAVGRAEGKLGLASAPATLTASNSSPLQETFEEVPSSPEPELVVMVGIATALAAWVRRRQKKARAS